MPWDDPEGWDGEGGVRGGSGRAAHVNPWLIHVSVWQKPLQYCKVISLQLIKINGKNKTLKKKKRLHSGHCVPSGSARSRYGVCLVWFLSAREACLAVGISTLWLPRYAVQSPPRVNRWVPVLLKNGVSPVRATCSFPSSLSHTLFYLLNGIPGARPRKGTCDHFHFHSRCTARSRDLGSRSCHVGLPARRVGNRIIRQNSKTTRSSP